jgi:hypothetical protein
MDLLPWKKARNPMLPLQEEEGPKMVAAQLLQKWVTKWANRRGEV